MKPGTKVLIKPLDQCKDMGPRIVRAMHEWFGRTLTVAEPYEEIHEGEFAVEECEWIFHVDWIDDGKVFPIPDDIRKQMTATDDYFTVDELLEQIEPTGPITGPITKELLDIIDGYAMRDGNTSYAEHLNRHILNAGWEKR